MAIFRSIKRKVTNPQALSEMSMDGNEIRIPLSSRTFHRYKILFVLLLPLAMSLMAVSSINVALPAIQKGLGATDTDLQWVLSGYALTFGITLIPAGRLGDAVGRGMVYLAGVLIFVAAAVWCGLSTTPHGLNIARLVQGVGSGMIAPQAVGMIQQYFRGQGRAKAFSLFGMVVSVAVAIGPLVSGAIISSMGAANGWRASFLFFAPLGVAALVLGLSWFPFEKERVHWKVTQESRAHRAEDRRRKKAGEDVVIRPRSTHFHLDLDPVGSVLIAGAVLCTMWPFMNHAHAWSWALLGVAVVLYILWATWESRYKAAGHAPMVDLTLFRVKSFTYCSAASTVYFIGGASMFVIVAIYAQTGHGASAIETGLLALPNAAISMVASFWAGRVALRLRHTAMLIAMAAIFAGLIGAPLMVFAMTAWDWPLWVLAIPLGILGWGQGSFNSVNQTLALNDIPPAFGGTAGGVKQTGERTATAIGNAMITGVFFMTIHRLTNGNWEAGFAAAYGVIAAFMLISLVLVIRARRDDRRQH